MANNKGWHGESQRHSLAARGVSSSCVRQESKRVAHAMVKPMEPHLREELECLKEKDLQDMPPEQQEYEIKMAIRRAYHKTQFTEEDNNPPQFTEEK